MAVIVHEGDCLAVLPTLPAASCQACVTDPPYHLASVVERFGAEGAAPAKSNGASGVYRRASARFIGKRWDGGDVAFKAETWREVARVLVPGAHLVAFGAPKTFHRLACAIEDGGFEIRDSLAWVFASGFPKNHDPGRTFDKRLLEVDPHDDPYDWAASRSHFAAYWSGWGTSLKPAFEPIVLARKPLVGTIDATLLAHGAGAINVKACKNDGLWPSTLVHDGSDEVTRALTDGLAANLPRFFYAPKAGGDDRLGSDHPTVKPTDLMRWLVRLVTPRGGVILDPFAGSGATAMAAMAEGHGAVMVEADAGYVADIRRRVAHVHGTDLPLFAAADI